MEPSVDQVVTGMSALRALADAYEYFVQRDRWADAVTVSRSALEWVDMLCGNDNGAGLRDGLVIVWTAKHEAALDEQERAQC